MKAENPQYLEPDAPAPAPVSAQQLAEVVPPQPKIERKQTVKLKEEMEADGMLQDSQDGAGVLDLEEKYHDPNNMPSMSVILEEIEVTDGQLKKFAHSPDEHDFFQFKKESLEFAKGTLETNFGAGVLTPQ